MQSINITTEFGRHPGANTLIYYSFDNSNLNDGSGNGNNGTWYSGAGSFVDGISGKCAQIAGTRGIRMPIAVPNGDFTYSICTYTTNLNSPTIQAFLGTVDLSQGGISSFHFHRSSNSVIAMAFSSDGSSFYTSTRMVANQRVNIMLTRSGNVWKMYMNGTKIYEFTKSISIYGGTRTVGCEYTDGRAINGKIDEVILENRAWTDAEILKYVQKLGLA